jgi:hypothetical protein
MFMVTLPAGEFDSDSQPDTDSSEDHLHGYISLVPRGDALRVFRRTNGTYGFPVYPNLMHQWGKLNEVKDHVLGMAKFARLRQDYKKKWSRHHVVARERGMDGVNGVSEPHQWKIFVVMLPVMLISIFRF